MFINDTRREMNMSKKIGLVMVMLLFFISVVMIKPGLFTKAADNLEEIVIPDKRKDSSEKTKKKRGINQKLVALTFDDGPNQESTRKILGTLKQHEVKGTFFMLGTQVEKYPEVVKEVSASGHEIGNHTTNHRDLMGLSKKEQQEEIKKTDQLIKEITGKESTYLRPPYGSFDTNNKKSFGKPLALWNVDSQDWTVREGSQIKQNVLSTMLPQSIVLFHDIYQETANSLDDIIQELKRENYEFVTVSEYFEMVK